MENYQIIVDEDKLLEFIDWLPELERHETYYCTLFARSKYSNVFSAEDKSQLKTFTSSKIRLLNKIKQLETKVETYLTRDKITGDDVGIPQESLAFYISVNPRDLIKATKQSLIEFAKLITEDYNGYNPYKKALTHIQQCRSRKLYAEFDYDNVQFEYVKEETEKILNKDCLNYVVTRGGVHCLVELQWVENKKYPNWYKGMQAINGFDNTSTELIPVPGTYQGGFCPKLIPSVKIPITPF